MNDPQEQDQDMQELDDRILQEEPDISTADAVSLFNTSLAKALAQQKAEILGELRKTAYRLINSSVYKRKFEH